MPYCLHVLLTFNHSHSLKTPFTFPAFAYAPAHCDHMSCIIFIHHFFSLFNPLQKKKPLPHLPFILFYPGSLDLLVVSFWIHTEYMWPIQAAKQR